MITTTGGLDTRVNIQQIIENQLPEFLLSESPNSVEFFKAYYLSCLLYTSPSPRDRG